MRKGTIIDLTSGPPTKKSRKYLSLVICHECCVIVCKGCHYKIYTRTLIRLALSL